jgi:hypothetical protein
VPRQSQAWALFYRLSFLLLGLGLPGHDCYTFGFCGLHIVDLYPTAVLSFFLY